jgi:hypothetical protein
VGLASQNQIANGFRRNIPIRQQIMAVEHCWDYFSLSLGWRRFYHETAHNYQINAKIARFPEGYIL